MDYNLRGLSTREFEHVSQALAQEILGPGVSAFGDGKDGGREATFEGRVPYPSGLEAWDGYGVVQAKFRQRTDQQPQDVVSWLKGPASAHRRAVSGLTPSSLAAWPIVLDCMRAKICRSAHAKGTGKPTVVVGDEAESARLLADQDRTTLLEAVRTAISGALTDEDIRRISNRKSQLQRFKELLTDADTFERERRRVAGPEAGSTFRTGGRSTTSSAAGGPATT